ncbi:hypothetical protein [Mesohalobacter halotolerans]|nr:hypothetical protein [Mesohalobacter halotolerans]
MKNKIALSGLVLTILMSCISKKKYVELENNYENTRSELQATRM